MKNSNEIIFQSRGWYMGYSEDKKILSIISRWKKVEMSGTYYKQNRIIGRSFLFPSTIYSRIAKVMGLPPKKKSKGRVRSGKTLSLNNFATQKRPIAKVA